jgi:DNA-binding transcriptional LysR family regulator
MLHLTSDKTADIYLGSDCQDDLATFRPLWSNQYCLIIPNSHALGFKTQVTLEQLQGVAIIEHRRCRKINLLMGYIRELQIERVASVDTEEWPLALVEQQMGLYSPH